MNRWLINLNGSPFLIVTCPDYMDPIAAARGYLVGGERVEGVTVEPARMVRVWPARYDEMEERNAES